MHFNILLPLKVLRLLENELEYVQKNNLIYNTTNYFDQSNHNLKKVSQRGEKHRN